MDIAFPFRRSNNIPSRFMLWKMELSAGLKSQLVLQADLTNFTEILVGFPFSENLLTKTFHSFDFTDTTPPKIEVSSTSVERIVDLTPVSVLIGTRVTMLPGARLEITCRATGIPEPTISWLRQDKQITSSGRFSIVNTTLVIHATQLEDRGLFTCAAKNTVGRETFSTKVEIIG